MPSLPLSCDAATVVGLAGSALPFAGSSQDEVERWLRPLRLYGEAGAVLQGMGIGEARLAPPSTGSPVETERPPEETVAAVIADAADSARQRGVAIIGTTDILMAVMRCYPRSFDQALESRGSDRWELIDRVVAALQSPLH